MIACKFEDGNEASLRHVVIDSLVFKDGKLLMVKRTGKLLEGGKWGLVGGFVDRDETLTEAAQREIFEETGWIVKNIQLLTVVDKPDRPKEDRQNIAFVYICEASEKTGVPDWESDEISWFNLDALPAAGEIAFDHATHIELYKKHLAEKLTLPIPF